MTPILEKFKEYFPNFNNTISSYVDTYWSKINSFESFFEIIVVGVIAFLSCLLQKFVRKHYFRNIFDDESSVWYHIIIYKALSFAGPFIAFVLLSFVMNISSAFDQNLEIYKFSIKLTLIWFVWNLIHRVIEDYFVRWVISCTIIPLMVFSAIGLSDPFLNYLDTLGFNLSDIHISIYVLLKGLLVATCLFWFARFLSANVSHFIENQKTITPEIRDLLEYVFRVVLYTTIVLLTLDLIGIDLKSLAIVGGAIGIGIGLGLQKIAANFISGILILFEQSVKVGHLVEVSGTNKPGWIRHLGARAAVIDTGDGRQLLIPNEELLTKTIVDWTATDKCARTDLNIKVSFDSDLEKAKAIMLEAIKSHPICSKSLSPNCYLEKFTYNGAQFLLQFWVDDLTVGKDMQNDVLLYIWRQFADNNIHHPKPLSRTDGE
jgi:small-conductance mechanosensitive channel